MPNNNNKTCNYQVARLSCSYHFSDTKLLNNFLCFSKSYHVPKFTADSEYYFPAGSELKSKVETQKKALNNAHAILVVLLVTSIRYLPNGKKNN